MMYHHHHRRRQKQCGSFVTPVLPHITTIKTSSICHKRPIPTPTNYQRQRVIINATAYRLRSSSLCKLLPLIPSPHQLQQQKRSVSEWMDTIGISILVIGITYIIPILPKPLLWIIRIVSLIYPFLKPYMKIATCNARFRLNLSSKTPRLIIGYISYDIETKTFILNDGFISIRFHSSHKEKEKDGKGCALIIGDSTLVVISLTSDIIFKTSPFVNINVLRNIASTTITTNASLS